VFADHSEDGIFSNDIMGFGFFALEEPDEQVCDFLRIAGDGENFFKHCFQKAAVPFKHRVASIVKMLRLVGVGTNDFGFVVAGFDGDNIDAEGGQFYANGLGESDEGVFAGRIGKVEGMADEAGQGGDIDDSAASSLNHLRDDGSCEPDGAEVVGLEYFV